MRRKSIEVNSVKTISSRSTFGATSSGCLGFRKRLKYLIGWCCKKHEVVKPKCVGLAVKTEAGEITIGLEYSYGRTKSMIFLGHEDCRLGAGCELHRLVGLDLPDVRVHADTRAIPAINTT